MPRSPALTQRLVQVAEAAAAAGHGNKEAVYTAACAELGMSRATLLRALGEVVQKPERKQRSDAGDVALSKDEALLISAVLMESHRKNNKRLLSIGQAVQTLRDNNMVRAEFIDGDGVIRPLSDSAIGRALRAYALHPTQLLRPSPAKELRSLHPNHVWQLDASLCVLYYLNTSDPRQTGLQVMEHDKFYKNKPRNLKKIESDRVWSYEVVDHNSGSIYLEYCFGAESAQHAAEAFINATQQREGEPMHGVPFLLMTDPGVKGALFSNLMRRLQVRWIEHKPGNARATGSVEKARDILERSFESGLKFKPVHSIEELNGLARKWGRWFNGTQVHTRHEKARWAQWQTIAEEQLRLAPPPDICRALLTHAPERRKVSDMLTVEFMGYGDFDVSGVPNVMVGEWLQVTYNPYDLVDGVMASAMVVDRDEQGEERLTRCPFKVRGEDGFATDANVIGEDWGRHADTRADINRKEVARIAMDAGTVAEAEAKRKAKAVPFGGRIDPFKAIEAQAPAAWLPKRGTPLQPKVVVPAAAPERVYTLFEAATELVRRGVAMSVERNAQVAGWFPDGVPETAFDELVHRLSVRATLRVVSGGAANE